MGSDILVHTQEEVLFVFQFCFNESTLSWLKVTVRSEARVVLPPDVEIASSLNEKPDLASHDSTFFVQDVRQNECNGHTDAGLQRYIDTKMLFKGQAGLRAYMAGRSGCLRCNRGPPNRLILMLVSVIILMN